MTPWAFSRFVALRYLWSKRSEAFISIITVISILGVAIGVMVLNIVMAVMTGFETTLREKIVGTDSHIVVHQFNGRIPEWQDAVAKISSVAGVKSVSPFTYNQVLLKSDVRSTGILVRGISEGSASANQVESYMKGKQDLSLLFNPPSVPVTDADGNETEANLPGLVIGRELAVNMALHVGETVSVLSPQVASSPFGLMPKFRRFVISGTYNSGLIEYESSVAYMDLKESQRFFNLGNSVTGLEIRVVDVNAAPEISKRILEVLGGTSSGFTASDWTVTNKALWDAIRLEKRVYFIVLLLIIVMASFSIITTLIMLVLEKRKDIAVMKTIGADTRSIGRIFSFQGAAIGAIGTTLGLVLGLGGCFALKEYGFPIDQRVFQMSELPVRIEWQNFVMTGTASFLICLFATIYPSRRASRLEPTDILRYE